MSWIFENETVGQALTFDSETYFCLECLNKCPKKNLITEKKC